MLNPMELPLVIITHDEFTFNANEERRQGWLKNGKQPLLPEGRGKSIMVSAFLTPAELLRVADAISDAQLLEIDPQWPRAVVSDKNSWCAKLLHIWSMGKTTIGTAKK